MPTITSVPPAWESGVQLPTDAHRRAESAAFLGDGSNTGVRGGIVRHGDNSLAVAVNGSDQITVQPGVVVIPAATGLGVYRASIQATTSASAGAISARNATNPRIDLVVFQIESGQAVIKTVDGTPGSSPSAPALPANAVELGRLNVPALGGGAATVSNAFRQYATALGGTLLVETAARLPGSGNQKGQRAVALDTGYVYEWNGSWTSPSVALTHTPTVSAASGTIGGASGSLRYTIDGIWVIYAGVINVSTAGSGTGAVKFTLPVPAREGVDATTYIGTGRDTSTGKALTVSREGNSFGNVLTYDNQGTVVAGYSLNIEGRYERA